MTYRKRAGKALIERIVGDMAARGLQPDAKERELLTLAETLAHELDGLRTSVKQHGYSTTLESGQRWRVANPAIAQINQTSLALAKVLAQVNMTDEPPVNRVKQRASQARWRAHNEAKARWEGA